MNSNELEIEKDTELKCSHVHHPAVSSPKDFTLTGRKCKSTGVSFDLSPQQHDLKEAPVHHVDCQTLCESLWYLISRFSLRACFPTSRSSAQVASVSDSSCLYLRICLFFSLSSVKALPSWCRSPTSIRPTRSTSTPSTGSTPTRKSTRRTLTCSRYEL